MTVDDVASLRAELEEAKAQAATLATDLDEFLQLASHDIQEPTRQLLGFAELLAVRNDDPAGLEMEVVAAARRVESLVRDLVGLYSQVSGIPTLEPVSLAKIVGDARERVDPILQVEQAEIIIDGPLPSVLGDRVLLGRLFENLFKNALAYRSVEAPVVRVGEEAGSSSPGERVIVVRDNGIGIPADSLRAIFQPFFRIAPTTEGSGRPGSGIGLAASHKIVTRLGGRIWAESEPGNGSSFHIALQAQSPGGTVMREPAGGRPRSQSHVALRPPAHAREADDSRVRLLLIEDTHPDARLVADALSTHTPERFDITHVTRLEAALDRLDRWTFDVILTDLNLPDSKGTATLHRVVEATGRPVVALTVVDDGSSGRIAVAEGAEDYIVKSQVAYTGLGRLLVNAVERASLKEQLRRTAATDPLTGLLNRRGLQLEASRLLALASRHSEPVSVVLVDVDDLKYINDTHGHAVGDRMIAATATALLRTLRTSDAVARFGGDEFVGLLLGTADSDELATRFHVALADELEGTPLVNATLSVGTVTASADTPFDTLVEMADEKMYSTRRDRRRSLGTRADADPHS